MPTQIQTGVTTPMVTGTLYSGNVAASALVKTGEGYLTGIFVSAASSTPTITLYDNTAGSGTTLVGVFTPAAATWYNLPFHFLTGLYIVISGTVACSISYE